MAAITVAEAQEGRTDPSGRSYWPALDALRGLAVAAVLLYHAEPLWMPGGFLGVSLFFTLSGFLITGLAVGEHRRTGRVGIRAFWGRRIRRLLPASLLALLLALAVTAVAVPAGQRLDAVVDIRAALLNLANWRFVLEGTSYADLHLVPSPVQHYWSLAIEEQFYLLFPLVALAALRFGARGLGVVLGTTAMASIAAQIALDDVDRIYFGTDTRAAELAVGGLLALALPHLSELLGPRRLSRLADVAGGVGLLVSLALWVGVQQTNPGLYSGGFAAVGVVSALLVLGAVAGRRTSRRLAARPLVALGRVSYGVYLFHFPLYLLLTEERLGWGAGPVLLVRLAATMVVATASYHLLEQPIRLRRVLPGRAAVASLAVAMVVVGLITLPAADRVADDAPALLDGGLAIVSLDPLDGPDVLAPAVTVAPATTDTSGAPAATSTTLGEAREPSPGVAPATVAPSPDAAAPAPPRAPRVLLVGDSTGQSNAEGLRAWGEETGRLEVASVTSPGCAVLHGPRFRVRQGYVFEPVGCASLMATAVEQARAQQVDAIVVFIGSSQLADWELPGLDGWRHIGEPETDAAYRRALAGATAALTEAGVPVLWADVPTPAWDLDAFGAMLGRPAPGVGPTSMNDPARAVRLEELDRSGVGGHPLLERWAYADLVGATEAAGTAVRADGLHVSVEGMAALAEAGLVDRLAAAYQAVAARTPVAEVPGPPPAWAVTTTG